jgi:hypothetical protein
MTMQHFDSSVANCSHRDKPTVECRELRSKLQVINGLCLFPCMKTNPYTSPRLPRIRFRWPHQIALPTKSALHRQRPFRPLLCDVRGGLSKLHYVERSIGEPNVRMFVKSSMLLWCETTPSHRHISRAHPLAERNSVSSLHASHRAHNDEHA